VAFDEFMDCIFLHSDSLASSYAHNHIFVLEGGSLLLSVTGYQCSLLKWTDYYHLVLYPDLQVWHDGQRA
jgi:hypothetical protein